MFQKNLIELGIINVCIKMEEITFCTVEKTANAQGPNASISDIPVLGFKYNETQVEIGLEDLFDRAMDKVGEIVYNPEYKQRYYQYCVAKKATILKGVLKDNAYYKGTSPDEVAPAAMEVDAPPPPPPAAAGGGAASNPISSAGVPPPAPPVDSEQAKQLRVISLIGRYMPQKPVTNPLLDFYEKANVLIDSVTEHLLSANRNTDINKKKQIVGLQYALTRSPPPVDDEVETIILRGIGFAIVSIASKYDREKVKQEADAVANQME